MPKPIFTEDPFNVLGIAPKSSLKEIDAAYKYHISFWHPDRNKSATAEEKMKELNWARELVLDPAAYRKWHTTWCAWKENTQSTDNDKSAQAEADRREAELRKQEDDLRRRKQEFDRQQREAEDRKHKEDVNQRQQKSYQQEPQKKGGADASQKKWEAENNRLKEEELEKSRRYAEENEKRWAMEREKKRKEEEKKQILVSDMRNHPFRWGVNLIIIDYSDDHHWRLYKSLYVVSHPALLWCCFGLRCFCYSLSWLFSVLWGLCSLPFDPESYVNTIVSFLILSCIFYKFHPNDLFGVLFCSAFLTFVFRRIRFMLNPRLREETIRY
jgi:curved DNA-binding protein CbpA